MNEHHDSTVLTAWDAGDDPRLETIALLQEEIARLEAELAARDAVLAQPSADCSDREAEVPHQRRIADLTAELAARDETVNLLLEQTRLFEEAAVAQRAEWDQLNRWVEEVERRVDGRDISADELRSERDQARTAAQAAEHQWETDRRAWSTFRDGLEREVRRLRGLLDSQHGGEHAAALREVEEENRRLRAAVGDLQRTLALTGEAEEWKLRISVLESELEQANAALRRLDDERRQQCQEHEAEIAGLRSRLSRESLGAASSPASNATISDLAPPAALEPDERIRAFRQHLKDLHQREADERAKLSFSARLSRLWKSTGPSGG